jgi:hypothetical protein
MMKSDAITQSFIGEIIDANDLNEMFLDELSHDEEL